MTVLQQVIEQKLGVTQADADFINANKEIAEVAAFCNLLAIQTKGYDPGGFAMTQQALKDLRSFMGGRE